MIDKKRLAQAVEVCLAENKGKRKFQQSVDLAIGFENVDFKKPDDKLNLTLLLPHAPKKQSILVYADGQVEMEAKNHADLVLNKAQVNEYSKDAKKAKTLVKYNSLAVPTLMAEVGKKLGKYLRGKMPAVLPPGADIKAFIERSARTISIKSKGKMLPAAHCIIGNESMSAEEITDNAKTVLEALYKKFNEHQFKSIVIKTTMGKPVKVK